MINFYDGHKVYMSGNYPAIFLNGKNVHLHRYVWEKYNGKIPEGFIVHHKDEDKKNWNIENLELLSRGEHVLKHSENLHSEASRKFGEKSRHHKLTQEQVNYIRAVFIRYDKEFGGRALAERFGVSPQCICQIVRGYSWGGAESC